MYSVVFQLGVLICLPLSRLALAGEGLRVKIQPMHPSPLHYSTDKQICYKTSACCPTEKESANSHIFINAPANVHAYAHKFTRTHTRNQMIEFSSLNKPLIQHKYNH